MVVWCLLSLLVWLQIVIFWFGCACLGVGSVWSFGMFADYLRVVCLVGFWGLVGSWVLTFGFRRDGLFVARWFACYSGCVACGAVVWLFMLVSGVGVF